MWQKAISAVSGGGVNITSITGATAQARSFSATVGHRYIVAFSNLGTDAGVSNPIDGLDVIANSGRKDTVTYSSVFAGLQVVIGTATASTVTCSWRNSSNPSYASIVWIDLDAQ